MGVVGYHPALLPANRGRHPIIWALVLGLKETGSTFFFMDEAADSGDILSQEKVPIDYSDDAESLYSKIERTAQKQVEEFLPKLESGNFERIPQNTEGASYWRKRSAEDGLIHWDESSETIYNLVRGLTKPYVGAHAQFRGRDVKIWRVKELNLPTNGSRPGQVLESDASTNRFSVCCGRGAVEVIEHNFENLPKQGESL